MTTRNPDTQHVKRKGNLQ